MKRTIATVVLMAAPIGTLASELEVRESPEAYPRSCAVDGAVIGVDYLRRSLPTPLGMQHIPGILIFELGVFPEPGRSVTLPSSSFDLDWKGLDRPETPAEPQLVVAQLLHEEWARGSGYPHVEVSAGTIDRQGRSREVIFGRPRREPRFPGDPMPDREDPRPQPRSSAPNVPRSEPHPDELPERIVPLHALNAGDIESPTAGFVYFLYRGKLNKLKRLVLNIQVGPSTCELRIRE